MRATPHEGPLTLRVSRNTPGGHDQGTPAVASG